LQSCYKCDLFRLGSTINKLKPVKVAQLVYIPSQKTSQFIAHNAVPRYLGTDSYTKEKQRKEIATDD
jgi:hypothetical protein